MTRFKVLSIVASILFSTVVVAQRNNSKTFTSVPAAVKKGSLVSETIISEVLKQNLVNLSTSRKLNVYLPQGYKNSGKSYPVVYYLHSIYGNGGAVFSNGAEALLDSAFSTGVSKEFIFVAADFSSANIGSLYENSPVSGRWLDFITQELVPYIDNKYRTLRSPNSRAVVGDFMGGRGALKLGLSHADMFRVVYALHPVATGVGTRPWTELGIDWQKLLKAKSFADLGGDRPCEIFVAICQAFLPNPNRPPFYCDYFMKQDSGRLIVDVPNMISIQKAFMLEQQLGESANNLQKLRGLMFDWARYDGNFDHIYAARAFTRNLEDLGIEHEAEEYRGTPWNKTWGGDGRFYTRTLPFLNKYLEFE